MGRDSAAVGVFADRAAPARLSARPSGDASRARGLRVIHDRRARRAPARGVPITGLGHRAGAGRAGRRRHSRRRSGDDPRRRLVARPADPRPRRLGGQAAATRAGRLGIRVRQRQLPRRRRHGRGGARAVPCGSSRTPSAYGEAIGRGARWVEGMQSSDGGWGAFDADNCRALVRDLPVLRLRRGDRSAQRRRDRARVEMLAALGRCHETRGQRGVSTGCSTPRRQTARGSAAGASTTSTARAPPCRRWSPRACRRATSGSGARSAGSRSARTPTADGARTAAPTTIRRGSDAARARRPRPLGRCSALDAAGDALGARCAAAFAGSSRRSGDDGSWDEPQFTGTGFPSDFYINYHLYRLVFPIMALGRCARMSAADAEAGERGCRLARPVLSQAREENFPVALWLLGPRTRAALRRSTDSRGSSTTSATRSPATGPCCSLLDAELRARARRADRASA